MMELTRHLEALLLDNDCVILPGFGGFITHYSPSRWIEEEKTFLPPFRTIGFNPQLKLNDGLLIQSYMNVYKTDFTEASGLVEKAINELKDTLQQEGYICMDGIGTLSFSIEGKYKFTPNEGGALTPELYGFHTFNMDKLGATPVYNSKKVNRSIEVEIPETKERKFYPALIRHTVAAAIAVIAFFLMSTPVENTYIEQENYASLFSFNIPTEFDLSGIYVVESTDVTTKEEIEEATTAEEELTVSPDIAISKPLSITLPSASLPEKQEDIKEVKPSLSETPVKAAPAPAKKVSYEIIVASIASRSDAPKEIQKYKNLGYHETSVVEGNGRIRISLKSFENAQDAYQMVNQIKQEQHFKDAWVLQVK